MPGEMQRLETIKRELTAQNEDWERIKAALLLLGDTGVYVPVDALEELDAICNPRRHIPNTGFRG
ncbi:MAG: hypothetical protein M3O50_20315 [Myxococcota bacterium]|nr:hypothetical protein [Myxococcota bacterium]